MNNDFDKLEIVVEAMQFAGIAMENMVHRVTDILYGEGTWDRQLKIIELRRQYDDYLSQKRAKQVKMWKQNINRSNGL